MKTLKRSDFVIPISIVIHLAIINVVLFVLTRDTYLNIYHILHYNISWLLITYGLKFYPTARNEKFMTNLHQMLQLFLIYGLAYFSLFGLTGKIYESLSYQFLVYFLLCLCLTLFRIIFYSLRKSYRKWGGNSVQVVVLGRDKNLKKLERYLMSLN